MAPETTASELPTMFQSLVLPAANVPSVSNSGALSAT
jgi:hypothetical protein